jgi:hypothetical protein
MCITEHSWENGRLIGAQNRAGEPSLMMDATVEKKAVFSTFFVQQEGFFIYISY